jgi:hypothetical protein
MLRALLAAALLSGFAAPPAAAQSPAPTVAPYSSDTAWSCQAANPSCARDPWRLERTETADATRIAYQAIGQGFTTERVFIEAVNLLWQWPEGKTLLRQADANGVTVISLAYDRTSAFASFLPERRTIVVNDRFVTAPTWMVADVLAHELAHAADNERAQSALVDCLARELVAFKVERQFLIWLTRSLVPSGLPALEVVSARLSADHSALAAQLYRLGFSDDLPGLVAEVYAGTC